MEKVRIAQTTLGSMISFARSSLPNEACGFIFGRLVDDMFVVSRAEPAKNAAREAPHMRFEIAPSDVLAAHKKARAAGEQVIGHYHSHPSGTAAPSQSDIEAIADPAALWIILGSFESEDASIGAYTPLVDGSGFKRLEVIAGHD